MERFPILLISLGTSPAIVPEAFLLPEVEFAAVHVLTTEKPPVSLVREFFAAHAPRVRVTITRVAGFSDFTGEADHFRFEEVLYRWILETGSRPEDRFFCLSGGFKTMSAAMQKAAALFGAAEVFHVLADNCCRNDSNQPCQPTSIDEILQARDEGHLHWIRLGGESGWPQLRSAHARAYMLNVVREEGGVRWVREFDDRLRGRVSEIVDCSQRIAERWDQLSDLPFAGLATWPKAELEWLAGRVDPAQAEDRSWVASLPKVELHCHLGGLATAGARLDEVRQAAQTPTGLPAVQDLGLTEDWPLPMRPVGLATYRSFGGNNGSTLLRDPGCLRRQCELLYAHFLAERVMYAEVRCSPANYADATRGRSAWDVLVEIRETFQAAMAAAVDRHGRDPDAPIPCHVNLIVIATRQERGDYRAGIARHLALAVTAAGHWLDPATCRVVGVDLAGFEDPSTRAHYFREEFAAVHRCGLALTVHAGENDDAEAIWRAVFDLNARRLGHALSLRESPELLRSITDRGIALEMCPYANLQIRGYPLDTATPTEPSSRCYPLLDYLRAGARVTVNTDNIGISAASLTDNLLLAARLCPGLTRLDVLRLQRNAIEAAFLQPVTEPDWQGV